MRTRAAAILAILLLTSGRAHANPFDFFGAGVRANGMGGAYTALGDDIAGLYYNPGALPQVGGLNIDIAYISATMHLDFDGREVPVDDNSGVQFGLLLAQNLLGRRLTFGANVFLPDDHVIRFQMLPRKQPQYIMVTNDNHVLVADVGGGYDVIHDRLGLGAALSLMGDNTGGVDLTLREDESSSGSLDTHLGIIARPILGAWGRPVDELRLGLCYREKTDVKLDLPNRIRIPHLHVFEGSEPDVLSASEITLVAQSYSHFSPRTVQFGAAYEPLPSLTTSADLSWQQWSEYHDPTVRLKINIDGGLGEVVSIQPQPALADTRFHDIVALALGGEYRPIDEGKTRLALRGGYGYRPSPAPQNHDALNLLDSDKHDFSAGLGIAADDPLGELWRWSLDAYARYTLLQERTVKNQDPTDPVGDYKMGGDVRAFGVSLKMEF
ncbi:MAG: outer membrane protein transport protein [Deltaproteobacteria bacterium]|nr:outer membrane protein transport protein [Deltaproteobacteria bacterium]